MLTIKPKEQLTKIGSIKSFAWNAGKRLSLITEANKNGIEAPIKKRGILQLKKLKSFVRDKF